MRAWSVVAGGVALMVQTAACQVPRGDATPQVKKEWNLGGSSEDLDRRDGRIREPSIIAYLQRLEDTIAGASSTGAAQIRVTRSSERYAARLPGPVLYISGGLLERMESEAELAGLLAHQLAHTKLRSDCVLASARAPQSENARAEEQRATEAATAYLRAAGYDPEGVLDLLSKLANEQPHWAHAILPEDLLALRAALESDAVPPRGYRIDSSQFQKTHATLLAALAPDPHRPGVVVLRKAPPSR